MQSEGGKERVRINRVSAKEAGRNGKSLRAFFPQGQSVRNAGFDCNLKPP